jgi:hypothetical protein
MVACLLGKGIISSGGPAASGEVTTHRRNLTLRVTWSSRSHLRAKELSFAEMPGIIAPGRRRERGLLIGT